MHTDKYGNVINSNGDEFFSGYDQYRQGKTVVPYGTKPGWGQVGMGYRQASPLASAAAKSDAKARMDHMMRARWEQQQAQQALEAQVQEHDAGYSNKNPWIKPNNEWKYEDEVPEITYSDLPGYGEEGETPGMYGVPGYSPVPDSQDSWFGEGGWWPSFQ